MALSGAGRAVGVMRGVSHDVVEGVFAVLMRDGGERFTSATEEALAADVGACCKF